MQKLCQIAFALVAFVALAPAQSFLRLETGGHTGEVTGLAILANSIVSASSDKTVRVWDAAGRNVKVIRVPIGPDREGQIDCLEASGSNMAFVSRGKPGASGAIYIASVQEGLAKPAGQVAETAVVSWDPKGASLATLDTKGHATLIDKSGKALASNQLSQNTTHNAIAISFSPTGDLIAYALDHGQETVEIGILDAHSLKVLNRKTVKGFVAKLAFGQSGVALSGSFTGLMSKGGELKNFGASDGRAVAWLDAGSFAIASNLPEGHAEVWSVDGKKLASLPAVGAPVMSIATSGKALVLGTAIGKIVLQSLEQGTALAELAGAGAAQGPVAWSADSKTVAWGFGLGEDARFKTKRVDITQAFNIRDLAPIDPPDDLTLGQTGVVRVSPDVLRINGREVRFGGEVNGFAMIDKTRIAVATADGLRISVVAGARVDGAPLAKGDGYVLGVAVSPDGKFLAASSTDQRLRIWNLGNPALTGNDSVLPDLTLYKGKDDEWIVWNEAKGVYACSPKGDEHLSVHTNEGNSVSFVPAYSRRDAYYRPDLIRGIAGGDSASLLQNVQSMVSTQAFCPQLKVASVEGASLEGDVWKTDLSEVKVSFKADKEVKRIVQAANTSNRSVDYKDKALHAIGDPSKIAVAVKNLRAGLNRVRFVASNDSGSSAEITLDIESTAKSNDNGALKVLTLGIGKYGGAVGDLPSAADAESVAKFFESKGAQQKFGGPVQVTRVPEDQGTKEGVLKALDKFQENLKPEDKVLVYVSAHGAKGVKDPGKFFLVPRDVDVERIDDTAVSWELVINKLKQFDCQSVALVQDTCHSGGVKYSALDANARNVVSRAAREANYLTFSSCQPDEVSIAFSNGSGDGPRSVFTMALLDAFAGKLPGVSKEGVVYLDRMLQPVRDRVNEIFKEKQLSHLKQRPTMLNFNDIEVPLGRAIQ